MNRPHARPTACLRAASAAASLCLCLCAFALAGCGDDEGGGGPTLAGIYQVTSHTLNTESCDAPGPTAPQPFAMLLADLQTFTFGPVSGTTMRVFDCGADVAACRALKAEQDPNNPFGFFSGFTFDKGNGAAGWSGSVEATSQANGGDCQATYREHTFAAVPKAEGDPADAPLRVRVEVREWSGVLPALPDDGEPGPDCDDRNLVTVVKQNPCERFELIEATFVE